MILDSKSHNIENLISKASKKYTVNSELIRTVIRAESDINPDCTSYKGAMGLMQLMPKLQKI